MIKKKLFLASSSELSADREQFEIFINRKNKQWFDKGIFLELILWEDFLDAFAQTRLQDEYNKEIKQCDLFIMLFWTKVGPYTEEEFETAVGQFKAIQKPFVFTYFKEENRARKVDESVQAFKKKLSGLGHFYTRYQNIDQIKLHFGQQLEKLAANGFIEFRPDDDKDAVTSGNQVRLRGTGAIAQGAEATAAGARGVEIRGANSGSINTGTQTNIDTGGGAYIRGNITAGRDFVGQENIRYGTSLRELEALFAPLLAAIGKQAPANVRTHAVEQVEELRVEVAKGKRADDGKIANIVDGLVNKIPDAASAIVSVFASPLLGSVAGPVTNFVLNKLKLSTPPTDGV